MRTILYMCFVFMLTACGTDDCQTCVGNTIQNADSNWTICDNGDGTVTNTNNAVDTSAVVNQGYAASVAFFESLNMTCN